MASLTVTVTPSDLGKAISAKETPAFHQCGQCVMAQAIRRTTGAPASCGLTTATSAGVLYRLPDDSHGRRSCVICGVQIRPDHDDAWHLKQAHRIAAVNEMHAALKLAEQYCPCGARPESPKTHPHVGGCLIGDALAKAEGL